MNMSDEWKSSGGSEGEDAKSWKLLEKALLSSVQEQRRSRRWGIFFKLLTFAYLLGVLVMFSPLLQFKSSGTGTEAHTALIEVRGMIVDQEAASADKIVGSLRAAFKDA